MLAAEGVPPAQGPDGLPLPESSAAALLPAAAGTGRVTSREGGRDPARRGPGTLRTVTQRQASTMPDSA